MFFFLFFITVAHVAHLALCLNHYLLFFYVGLAVAMETAACLAASPLKERERIASSQELAYTQCNHGGELK